MNLHQRSDTLTECDREPIHHIAAVQSFGGLIATDEEGRIAHVSANVAQLLGLAFAQQAERRAGLHAQSAHRFYHIDHAQHVFFRRFAPCRPHAETA